MTLCSNAQKKNVGRLLLVDGQKPPQAAQIGGLYHFGDVTKMIQKVGDILTQDKIEEVLRRVKRGVNTKADIDERAKLSGKGIDVIRFPNGNDGNYLVVSGGKYTLTDEGENFLANRKQARRMELLALIAAVGAVVSVILQLYQLANN